MNTINKGSIVRYGGGWYRVSAKFNNSVNLCGVWNGKIVFKKVALNKVFEDGDAFYKWWQTTEQYKCM